MPSPDSGGGRPGSLPLAWAERLCGCWWRWIDASATAGRANQPGTTDEYLNWRVPLTGPDGQPMLLEDIFTDRRAATLGRGGKCCDDLTDELLRAFGGRQPDCIQSWLRSR